MRLVLILQFSWAQGDIINLKARFNLPCPAGKSQNVKEKILPSDSGMTFYSLESRRRTQGGKQRNLALPHTTVNKN